MPTTSETRKSTPKKHPLEDFWRATRAETVSPSGRLHLTTYTPSSLPAKSSPEKPLDTRRGLGVILKMLLNRLRLRLW